MCLGKQNAARIGWRSSRGFNEAEAHVASENRMISA